MENQNDTAPPNGYFYTQGNFAPVSQNLQPTFAPNYPHYNNQQDFHPQPAVHYQQQQQHHNPRRDSDNQLNEPKNENRIQKNQNQRANRLRQLADHVRRQAQMLNKGRQQQHNSEFDGLESYRWVPFRGRIASVSSPIEYSQSISDSHDDSRLFVRSTSFSSTGSRIQTTPSPYNNLSPASSQQFGAQLCSDDELQMCPRGGVPTRFQQQQPFGELPEQEIQASEQSQQAPNQNLAYSPSCLSPSDALNLGINLEQYISKRNERERSRVKTVNEAFENLRFTLPLDVEKLNKRENSKFSKVEILKTAINYIKSLEDVLGYKRKKRIEKCLYQEEEFEPVIGESLNQANFYQSDP